MKNDYFFLTWNDDNNKNCISSAFSNREYDSNLIEKLENKNIFPFEFNLVKICNSKKGLLVTKDLENLEEIWLDYQPNDLCFPLMSKKLKDIISNSLTEKEGVDWIVVKLNGLHESRLYYIPRFSKKMDVLDFDSTIFGDKNKKDIIIKPCFLFEKIENFSIFHLPTAYDSWKITKSLYVKEDIKNEVENNNLIGVEFHKISVL